MDHIAFDALTRRASLRTNGMVLADSITTDAKKRRKKKRNKGDADKLCKRQVGQCLDLFIPACEDDLVCQVQIESCCSALGSCDLDGFFVCIADAGSNTARAHAALLP